MFSEEIETLQKSTWTLQKLMGKDTFDLNHAMKQPEKLRALGIFDEKTARLLAEAWLTDGGFFMVLYSIGIELDSDIVRMAETIFEPEYPWAWQGQVESAFRLDNQDD